MLRDLCIKFNFGNSKKYVTLLIFILIKPWYILGTANNFVYKAQLNFFGDLDGYDLSCKINCLKVFIALVVVKKLIP